MNETEQPAVAGPVEPIVRPVAWADDAAVQGCVGNCASAAAKEYWERGHWVDKASAAKLKHPLFSEAQLADVFADATRWRKLRDTPATHMPPGPMRQWLFARPGGADSMDRMVDEWGVPNNRAMRHAREEVR